eukprot:GEMP01011662.1.p1 GENE.GEMP01011662.1~~GEMP01011662.1.p1  ORF type:complete len:277 (+),score=51.24 GEMP01011662.1:250-1080(+)
MVLDHFTAPPRKRLADAMDKASEALSRYQFRGSSAPLRVKNLTGIVPSGENASSFARVLFEDLSFEVSAGEIAFVTGKSGQGKSFLLRCIAGLEEPSAGRVTLGSNDTVHKDSSAWRQKVMYIPPSLPDYEGTPDVFKRFQSFRSKSHPSNLSGVSRVSVQNLARSAPSSSAHGAQGSHPKMQPIAIGQRIGLTAEIWRMAWSRLSTGERHRLYLAMALALQPHVMLLDESLGCLDISTSVLVERELRTYSTMAIIWVTHNVSLIQRTPHGARISL